LSSHVAQPSHILQAFCSRKTSPIVQSLVPLQQGVLSPMWGFAGPQARVRPVYVYAWNPANSNSPSPVYNPTTAKDLKRTAARVSLYDLLLLREHFHPKKLRALCGSE
jgi:hypothetical protein